MTRIVSDEELRIALGKVNANIPFPSAQSFIGKLREKLDRGVNFKEARDYSLNESRIWGVSERAWYRKLARTVFGARSARAATARSKKNPEKKGAAVKTSSEATNSHALAIFEDTHGQLGFKL